jgi:hypothetical protein
MRVHLRRRVTKLAGQILAALRVAAAPGSGFVAAPLQCPALPASPLLAGIRAALATRPTGIPPRAASLFRTEDQQARMRAFLAGQTANQQEAK